MNGVQRYDPVRLEVYRNLFASIAEEMGVALQRSAYSPNITERRDYSCALFDQDGRLIAQGDHMPVHLGSMPASVRAALAVAPPGPGEMILLNDPFHGGTHLPDLTLVAPLHAGESGSPPAFYLANRAHHSDVGGMSPGSMPLATEIFQEGIRLPPIRFIKDGEPDADLMRLILANVRTPEERVGDLMAQVAANRVGERRLAALIARHGREEVAAYARHLIDYASRLMSSTIGGLSEGRYQFTDHLDDDGITDAPIPIVVTLTLAGGRARVDFAGSAPQVAGPVNAVEAITRSAVLYAFRCLLPQDSPANDGCFEPLDIIAPVGTVVNARPPASVAGGNVETSQRIVDTVFGALAQAAPDLIPAASSGTMNNVTIGGVDPTTGTHFAYYETIAGGMGARPEDDGLSGVHTHMTNSLNTPIEALERALPIRMTSYTLRRGSGGGGLHQGGDGIIRTYQFLGPAEVTLLADRRRTGPWGLAGGEPGAAGRDTAGSRKRSGEPPLEVPQKRGDRRQTHDSDTGRWRVGQTAQVSQETPAEAAHRKLRVTMVAASLYDLVFAVINMTAPGFGSWFMEIPLPADQFYLRFTGVFLFMLALFYLLPVIHPGEYLGNVVVAIIGRGFGALFLIGAVLFFGYPKAFIVLGAGDFLFSVFHLYYLAGAEGGNPFRHYLD